MQHKSLKIYEISKFKRKTAFRLIYDNFDGNYACILLPYRKNQAKQHSVLELVEKKKDLDYNEITVFMLSNLQHLKPAS